MTKLEWCKQHAPTLWQSLPDEELMAKMSSAWDSIKDTLTDVTEDMELESVEYDLNDINNHLDYMVLELNREFGNKLAFKGGYMLTKIMSKSARQTSDIDFSILSDEVYDDIKTRLVAIADHFIEQEVIDEYKLKDTIKPTMSGGIDMYKDGVKVLGVDVGWHNITYGTHITKLDVGDVNSFEIERMVADKITAILSRKRFRRPKDIYDLYCISQNFDIDLAKVHVYMYMRGDESSIEWNNYPFNETVLCEYEKAYNSLRVVSIYKNGDITKPEFKVVYSRLGSLVAKLLSLNGYDTWNHLTQLFE